MERKRENLIRDLSPEYMAHVMKMRGIAAQHLKNLKKLERALYEDPILHLLEGEGANNAVEQFSAGELAMLRQKATYFRKMRRFGANQLDSDIHTH